MVSAIDARKVLVLKALCELDRPIWVGDLDPAPLAREHFRPACNALIEDGVIEKFRCPGTATVFYRWRSRENSNLRPTV